MLRVTVAEVQRTLLKQFGINIGAAINSGNFSTKLLTENALPADGRRGSGLAADPGVGNGPVDPTVGPTRLTGGDALQLQRRSRPLVPLATPASRISSAAGNTQLTNALRALERDGLIRTLAGAER